MSDKPLDLDRYRGLAAQKATDIRRILADVETNAKDVAYVDSRSLRGDLAILVRTVWSVILMIGAH